MEVRVAGHQVDTGESLREEAQRRISEITEKYFARSIGDLQDIVRALKAKGVTLKATEQPIDTSTAAGKAFLDMLGVFAEFDTRDARGNPLGGGLYHAVLSQWNDRGFNAYDFRRFDGEAYLRECRRQVAVPRDPAARRHEFERLRRIADLTPIAAPRILEALEPVRAVTIPPLRSSERHAGFVDAARRLLD